MCGFGKGIGLGTLEGEFVKIFKIYEVFCKMLLFVMIVGTGGDGC